MSTLVVDGRDRPLHNSLGRLIHPTEVGIRHFWRWFGNSAVVDAEGRPLVVYHGTAADVVAFDAGRHRTVLNDQYQGDGFHFSPDPCVASRYADADRNLLLRKDTIYAQVEHRFPGRLGQLFRDVVEHGYEQAWELPDEEIRALLRQGEDEGVDLNALLDLARLVEGSNYDVRRSRDLDPGAVYAALFGGSSGIVLTEYHIAEMVAMGLDAAIPCPNVMPVYLRAEDILVTHDRQLARAARSRGHDGVFYTGPDLVEGCPEWVVFDASQIKSSLGNSGAFAPGEPSLDDRPRPRPQPGADQGGLAP